MKNKYLNYSKQVKNICSHISVREDENGPCIFALGLKETHTLQLRRIDQKFTLQLWYGSTAETEKIVSEPCFANIEEAFSEATNWLNKDTL